MKIACDIIKDLLPLYIEGMVSETSKKEIAMHFDECADCKAVYEQMTAPKPEIHFNTEPAKSFKKYIKKEKRRFGWKVALLYSLAILAAILIWLITMGGLIGFLASPSMATMIIDSDISHYSQYMGKAAEKPFHNKMDMDESIFPEKITANMNVIDYKMVYYNPWDPQYLSYLVVEYDDAAYDKEISRLKDCLFEEYVGYYGAEGFPEHYELLAMNADASYGFIYALAGGDKQIIYVEILFCNYFMDLDYTKYINPNYLPIGFDATSDNPYRDEMLQKNGINLIP